LLVFSLSFVILLGDKSGAERAFRTALTLHPWAAHVPTVLWSIKHEEEKLKNQEEEDVDGEFPVHTAGEDDTGDTQRNTGKNAGDKDKDK
jgi:hypothetical protein